MNQQHTESAESRLRTEKENLASLITQRGRLDADAIALNSSREEHAYSACTGDSKAQKHLTSLNSQFQALRDRESTLSIAIRTAELRVRSAEADFRHETERRSAKTALQLAETLRNHGRELDCAVKTLVSAYDALHELFSELRIIGAAPVNTRLLTISCREVLKSCLHATALQLEPVPPSRRRDFGALCHDYARRVEQFARLRLDPEKLDSEEAA